MKELLAHTGFMYVLEIFTPEAEVNEPSIKDGAFYCYCAYVLRISRYWGFPIGDAYKYSDIFARFKSIRRK